MGPEDPVVHKRNRDTTDDQERFMHLMMPAMIDRLYSPAPDPVCDQVLYIFDSHGVADQSFRDAQFGPLFGRQFNMTRGTGRTCQVLMDPNCSAANAPI